MQPIKVGVAGVGRLGQLHARLYCEVEGAHLIGVYDIDMARAQTLADDLSVHRFETFDELMAATEAVNIVVPTIFHFALSQKALTANKHIFIEKPITTTVDEASELIALAAQKRRVLQVGHIERFNAALRALDEFPLTPRFIESHRLASFDPRGTDVAVVLDLMIHDIDIILTLVKSPLTRIDANGVAVVSDEPDIANVRLQFANGCVANVTASRISQKKMRKMRIFQRDAYVSIDFLEGLTEVFRLVSPEEAMSASGFPVVLDKLDQGARQRHIIYDKLQAPEGNALKMELQSFVDSIRDNSPPPVTGEDGRRALEVATTITEVIKKNSIGQDQYAMRCDDFLHTYDVTEHHDLDIQAPVEKVYAAVCELDLSSSKLVRNLFWLRGLPALFCSRHKRGDGLGLTMQGLLKSGFVLLGETPRQEIVLGLIGKFWTASGCIQNLDAAGFQNFTTPGFAKAVWNFYLEPQAHGATKLHTETRVLCLDAASRRRFRFYWLFIRPFSGLVRRAALRAIKRNAENF